MLNINVSVSTSEKKGKGLFANSFIPKNTLIWQLDDKEKRLTKEEVEKLSPVVRKLAYQFDDKYVVATDSSELMNHSCDPNTWWNDDKSLVASRDIQVGEEITYDYSTADIGDYIASWRCDCGSDDCRKHISGKDCFGQKFQEKYKGHLPSWTVKYIEDNCI